MTIKQVFRVAATLMIVSTTGAALAVSPYKDKGAQSKIDEAINVHYISAQFDKAEAVLLSAIKSCGAKECSPEVVAKAYLYLGIIRGNGKQDIEGAKQAFELAYAADPNITIDPSLVTPAVLAEFNNATGKEGSDAIAPDKSALGDDNAEVPGEKKVATQARVAPVGELRCTPGTGYEIEVGRPVPIHCEKMEGVLRGELYYKPLGAEEYVAMLMKFNSKDATLSAQVPCDALTRKGTLNVYVVAQDENRDLVETFGNALSPVQYPVANKTAQPPPTLPGEPPPAVCKELLDSLRNGRGTGQTCTSTARCRKDNYCHAGVCAKAPTCEMGSDCESGHCIDSICVMKEEFADDKKPNKWMVGLNFGWDFWVSPSRNNVCGDQNPASGVFSCYNSGTTLINADPVEANPERTNRLPMANANYGGNIKSTLIPATMRALLSVDRIVSPHATLGGRVGFAFGGGPAKIKFNPDGTPTQTANFLPIHIEARAAYYFQPIEQLGHHLYIAAGAGVAEVDGKVSVTAYADNASGRPTIERKLDVWRKLGVMFATAAVGETYRLAANHNLQANLNVMVFFPSAGFVLEPSLGYLFSF